MVDTFFGMLRPAKTGSSQAKLRAAGDAARDRHDWLEAESLYRGYLDQVTDDAAIWVQLGHALKEQNRVDDARLAYDRAIELAPADADAHLQRGHALKLLGLRGEAVVAYEEALRLGDTDGAFDELVALGQESDAKRIALASDHRTVTATFLEITDLLNYLKAHPTLSGIQRVQASIARHVCSAPEGQDHCRFVIGSGANLLAVSQSRLSRLIDYVTGPLVNHDRLREAIAEVERTATFVEPRAGDSYVILGSFWGARDVVLRCAKMKAAGVRIGAYLYDLIPISHPEFCDAALSHDFVLSVGDIFLYLDFIVTISEFTAKEVRGFLVRHGLRDMPVRAVPLAHRMTDGKALPSGWTPAIAALKGRRYVLCVSTIEARKNHAFLFHLWKHLSQEEPNLPDLVFVGRYGWHVSDLFAQIEGTRHLDGRLHILHDLTDRELTTLYDNCLFTAFTSLIEGWGLPVGESLTHGKVCIASKTSSIPEVGGEFVEYIDPYNLTAAEQIFRRMILDDEYRHARETQIQHQFKARLWADVATDFFGKIKELADITAPEPRIVSPELPRGVIFRPGLLSREQPLPANYARYPLRAILADSWFGCEDFGAWMNGDLGRLSFYSDAPEGEAIMIVLRLLAAPHTSGNRVTVTVGDNRVFISDACKPNKAEAELRSGQTILLRLHGRVGAGGNVDVLLRLAKPPTSPPNDRRLFALGLLQLGYVPVSDAAARQNLLEEVVFLSP